ncbi:ectoine hydroxylase [Rhodococcus sp. WMMA185]|uniref:ectoine hydroxylase n=1 Tax=Rhodococcus sp. WMMA185 TaxID=679318 RepID=UPI0008785604|nr:ectoine hydroxylase [Rhodococcus sp. WMMA185]AOW93379.1 ectoine hydroxylase [Rhodococcus sp. WMMA185]
MRTAVADSYPTRDRNECTLLLREDPVTWFDPLTGDPKPGPLSAAQLEDYDRRGYHCADKIIPPQDVFDLLDEMTRLAETDTLQGDARVVRENGNGDVRSIFDVHRLSDVVDEIVRRPEVVGIARQILGSEVYIHQSRLNFKPGFTGGPFYWHSDFETWHAEDGMPRPRAASISIALTENYGHNGGLMIMPGSHRAFVSCAGETPEDYYKESLVSYTPPTGSPDRPTLTRMANEYGIDVMTGAAGSATVFDSNCMHGSNGNITPFSRSNLFIVFNSVENTLTEPFAAPAPRPDYLGSRDFTPLR